MSDSPWLGFLITQIVLLLFLYLMAVLFKVYTRWRMSRIEMEGARVSMVLPILRFPKLAMEDAT